MIAKNIKIKGIVSFIVLGTSCIFSLAFSPYENYLLSGKETHVALFAQIKEGQENAFAQTLKLLYEQKSVEQLQKADIRNLSAFQKPLNEKTYCMLYFDYKGGKDYLGAAKAFEKSCPVTEKLNALIIPHPRAERYGCKWLQMEWITFIRGKDVKDKSQSVVSMVTRIKPEKEMEYRMLHQGVWPGVVDQMERGNCRNFSIFLVELGDEIYEFFYYEYVGTDAKKDDAMNTSDPANLRWWKQTDPCQDPLPEMKGKGIWAPMETIAISM
ncbi:MAG: L-rhamnose mutarotase [Sedimentisphaerales bacterium]|nr:L-rhamnose mutarotase [Sedimentisphaerales bacterium]